MNFSAQIAKQIIACFFFPTAFRILIIELSS